MAPWNAWGSRASGRSGMLTPRSRIDRIRSRATLVAATALVIFARSCTGLKNLARYERNTVSDPTVSAPARISRAPLHSTIAVHNATIRATTGERSDLDAPGAERRLHGRAAGSAESLRLDVLGAEGLYRSHRLESGLEHVHDVALAAPDFMGRPLDRSPEPRHEQQQKGRDRHDDERKVPVEPEHQAEHTDDRQEIDEDAQRRRGHKILDRGDIVRDRAEEHPGLVRVVVVEREAFDVVIQPHAEVVGDPLAHALRVVAVD